MTITRQDLTGLMEDAFGTSDANGDWSMRDAYDASELAHRYCSRSMQGRRSSILPTRRLRSVPSRESCSRYLLPTQTYRSETQIALQQFSTAAPLAFITAQLAGLDRHGSRTSAGTGLLAAHAVRVGAKVILNELDEQRAGLLARAPLPARNRSGTTAPASMTGPGTGIGCADEPALFAIGRHR